MEAQEGTLQRQQREPPSEAEQFRMDVREPRKVTVLKDSDGDMQHRGEV